MNISIIIPTYNRADTLEMCLNYLVELDYPYDKYEIIVVDNNSPDNTKQVVEKFQSQYQNISIRYIFEKQKGIVHARHAGAYCSKYDILSYIDDDGFLNKTWLKEVADVFKKNIQVAAVASKIVIKWDSQPPDWIEPYEWLLGKLDYGPEVLIKQGLYVNGGSFSIKKDVLFELGGFDIGQRGEFLVGNSEDGLNERLWKSGYLIGYTPYAVMEHYQLVHKNARESDIKRRYINLGIRIPYKLYAIDKRGYYGLIFNMMKRIKGIIIKFIQINFLSKGKSQEHVRYLKFLIAHDWAQIPYTMRIIFNKKFRGYIKNKNSYTLNA